MGHKIKMLQAIMILVIAALIVSSCASGAAPTPTAAPKAPAQATAAPAKEKQGTPATPAASSSSSSAAPTGQLPKSVTIATSSPGSTLYAMGTGLAKVASDAGPIQVILQPFSGAPAYLPQMEASGKPDLAILNSVEAWQALTAKSTPKAPPAGITIPTPYSKPYKNVRALMLGTNLTTGMLVRKDSKYQTYADLKGARVAWGFKAQAGAALAAYTNAVLGGLNPSNVKTVEVPDPVSAVRALQEGRLDAACLAIGMGATAEADAQVGVRFLDAPRDAAAIKEAQGLMPGGNVVQVKAGRAAGLPKDTYMWGYPTVVIASTNMPDNVAYALTKVWWDNYQKLAPIDAQFQDWKPDIYVSKDAVVPYHPGAIAFYKEKGVWTPEMDKIQEQLLKGELPAVK